MIKHIGLRFTLLLILLDTFLITGALATATYMRLMIPVGLEAPPEAIHLPPQVYALAIVVYALAFALLDVRNPSRVVQAMRELQLITSASVLGWMMFLGALYLTFRTTSRLQIIYFLGVHLLLVVASRLVLRFFYFKRRQWVPTHHVVVVGTNDMAQQMFRIVQQHTWMGLNPVGTVALHEREASDNTIGTVEHIEGIVRHFNVTEVVVAVPRDSSLNLNQFVHQLQALPVNIRVIPQYTDLAFLQVNVENFSGIPLLSLKEPVLTPYQRFMKRTFDVVVTLIIMVPALPLMGLIALLVKLDSRGPILFKQRRIGEQGQEFTMLKFRSMLAGAEWRQEEILRYDDKGNIVHKRPDDPRITRVGRFLRETSLDELPQLFNILRGDMSLVGPRPEMPWLVDNYEPWQRKRFEVPQGLTGWWQVNGRANKPMHTATDYDLFYIRNYSMWLDLQILWRTIWVVLSRRGAY